jgi:RNA polymerase sigma-70 factor (ECF subfamily)
MTPLTPPLDITLLSTPELVVEAQNGNRKALELLIKQIQKPVFVTLSQLLPERNDVLDLTQEVLVRVCRALPSLRNANTFKPWLNRIITNLFYDELRKKQRRPDPVALDAPLSSSAEEASATALLDTLPDTYPAPAEQAQLSELDEQIRQGIAALPEPFRTTLILREFQHLNYDEIASVTDTSLGTVKSRLARARQRLQEHLAPYMRHEDS